MRRGGVHTTTTCALIGSSRGVAAPLHSRARALPVAPAGLPTGSSPLAMYRKLIELHKAGEISFANVVTFK